MASEKFKGYLTLKSLMTEVDTQLIGVGMTLDAAEQLSRLENYLEVEIPVCPGAKKVKLLLFAGADAFEVRGKVDYWIKDGETVLQ